MSNKHAEKLRSIVKYHDKVSEDGFNSSDTVDTFYQDITVYDLTEMVSESLWEAYREEGEITAEEIHYVDSLLGAIRMKLGFPSGNYWKTAEK
jgi:hypothetical protein